MFSGAAIAISIVRMNDDKKTLVMPEPEPSGFVKTLNNMGYMTSTLDPFSKAFVEFSVKAPGASLDIGAAYGVAAIEALKLGASVIANDIEEKHLEILKNRTPKELHSRLTLLPGAFPNALMIPENTVGSVLACRVFHFFDGPTIEFAAKLLFQKLLPKGKVFIVTETPFLKNFSTFIPTYLERKAEGEKWPGFISDVKAVAPERAVLLPPTIHFLDPDVLTRVFKEAGFEIERCEMIARKDFPADLQLDGRESVGLIACKKG